MIKTYECTQCGSTAFEDVNNKRLRCIYCGSLFQLITNNPAVAINQGAKVVFGRKSNVEIRGDLEIQNGANVDIRGNVTVMRGNKKQKFGLKLIQAGKMDNRKK